MKQPKIPVRVVVCAAVKYVHFSVTDIIIASPRHFDSIMEKQISLMNSDIQPEFKSDGEQGFLDQFGVFMNRGEALLVASAANQINTRRPKTNPVNQLFSEDLY